MRGERQPARAALAAAGISPVVLGAKEGLALINGTQISTALALHGLFMAERVFEAAVISGAMAVDAAKGSDAPFDPRLHELRGHAGQIATARAYRELLAGSAIRASHLVNDDRVQDPYSLRCQPQVMGACLDLIAQAARTLLIEANAVTDNPLVFARPDAGSDDGALRRQLPRRARRVRGRHAGAGDRRDRRAVGTTHRAADRCDAVRTAAVPGARSRRQLGLHDRARDRGRAGLGEQVARASGQRRQPADLGQPGGSRQHGDLCGAPAARDGRQHARRSSASNCSPRRRASTSTRRSRRRSGSPVHTGWCASVCRSTKSTASWRPISRPPRNWWRRGR